MYYNLFVIDFCMKVHAPDDHIITISIGNWMDIQQSQGGEERKERKKKGTILEAISTFYKFAAPKLFEEVFKDILNLIELVA